MKIVPSDYNILVVDDIISNVMLLKAILKKYKYNIDSATSGEQAIEIIRKKTPDLILLDVMMPGMSGYDVVEYIRKDLDLQEVQIIMLTALNSNEDIIKGFAIGANDFVSKPFNNEVLLKRMEFQLSVIASRRIIEHQAQELRNTIKTRDKLYSVIAHDLRSPLATCKMIMNFIMDQQIPNEKVSDDLKEMLENVNQITEDAYSLFDNLLKWTKTQTGQLKRVVQDVNANEIVEGSIGMLELIAQNKNIALNVSYAEHEITLKTDIDMNKTVFRNLVSNAIKFSNEGSTIEVLIEADDKNVYYSVIDHGAGMDEKKVNKILSGTVDFSNLGTRDEEGSGLGLILAKEFVERNGGEMSIESKVGEGSTFKFYLPR